MAIGDHVRNFSKFFTNLTPGQREEFERAMGDLNNSQELTSLSSSLELLRRKPDQRLPIPQVTTTTTIRGSILEWEPLDDQRINFYEVDIADNNIFSSFTTVSSFGLSTVIDGLTGTKYARVRGVRRDGTTTPYSDTIEINPNLYEVREHTVESFYIPILTANENLVLGGAGTDMEYEPINPDGNSMVWGFIAIYADSVIGVNGDDSITIKLVSSVFDDDGAEVGTETTQWENTPAEYFNSISIGPVAVAHPELNQTLRISLVVQDSSGNNNTHIEWCHMSSFELGIGG